MVFALLLSGDDEPLSADALAPMIRVTHTSKRRMAAPNPIWAARREGIAAAAGVEDCCICFSPLLLNLPHSVGNYNPSAAVEKG